MPTTAWIMQPSAERDAAEAWSPDTPGGVPPRGDAPATIGGYRLHEVLGHGGMGIVYLATAPDGSQVALKLLSDEAGLDPVIQRRFLREARVAGALRSPHVVTCLDTGEDHGRRFIAMELMRGGNAQELAERHGGALDEARATLICRDAAAGLEALHAADLVHRDVKPANLFLTGDGRAKLGDFGIVRTPAARSGPLTRRDRSLGTLGFMAPEQFRSSQRIDIRADIYALGATLFHLLTGRMPFVGDSLAKVIAQLLCNGIPDPRSVRSDCSEGIAAIVKRAGALAVDDRYDNPRELREDLDLVIAGHAPRRACAPSAATTEVLRRDRTRSRRHPAVVTPALQPSPSDDRGQAGADVAAEIARALGDSALQLADVDPAAQSARERMDAIARRLAPLAELPALADEPFQRSLLSTVATLSSQLARLEGRLNASSLRTLRQCQDTAAGIVARRLLPPDLAAVTALVVDDDLVSRKTMCQALRRTGIDADAMASGTDALAALSRRTYGIVLSDLLMADMNGLQFADRARQALGTRRVPIILVTMLADFDKTFRARTDGADDALAKPFLLAELAGKVLCHLTRCAQPP